jgi:peptide/nickel transport system substrate-binding protein
MRTRSNRSRSSLIRLTIVSVAVLALMVAAVACGASNSRPSAAAERAIDGGTAVWVSPPSTVPNYIFPYESINYLSIANGAYFTAMMYRPLYWFGNDIQPTLNESLSLAYPPVFNGDKVTIRLKHYEWSNGTQVTAQDVMFWLHMLEELPQDWGGYNGFPTNVKDITVVSPTELTMVMNKSYSPAWFLYNNLSQITPMPTAWDRTAAGPSNCVATISDCAKVYTYLDAQSKALGTYATSPLWSVVDGPWRLSAFNPDGHITFVPNKSYSGPIKPKLAEFKEIPFTTENAEYNALRSPSKGEKIDVGYLPTTDAPQKPADQEVGANPLQREGYSLVPQYVWDINYYVLNFQSTTGNGPVLRQLYFRQALAYLTNQDANISGPMHGYGVPTVGPVPNTPVSQFLSPEGRKGDPYPYNPAEAKSLLTSHGWKVVPNGITTCVKPSLCGPGISKGHALVFNFPYGSGTNSVTDAMTQLHSSAALLGIKLNMQPQPFNKVVGEAAGNCVVAKISCDWDLADWGGGWLFSPEFMPTGEELFMSGSIANAGGYSNATNDAMIKKTLTSGNLSYLYQWQDYLAKQLPMIWMPNGVAQLSEIADNLRGVTPQSPTLGLTPENWYFVN